MTGGLPVKLSAINNWINYKTGQGRSLKVWDATLLAEATGGQWDRNPLGPIAGFAIDSRKIETGQMFIALKTGQRDGHSFLSAALQSGASAALVATADPMLPLPQLVVTDPLKALQKAGCWQRKRFQGRVIAITGSSGKTSTKNLLKTLLGAEHTFATAGNFNNHIGVPLSLLGLDNELHQYAVIEAGMNQPGEIATLRDWIAPDISVVTSVGPAHLEGVESLENVAREKAALCQLPLPDKHAFFHYDCLSYGVFRNLSCCVHALKSSASAVLGSLPENFQTLNYTMTEQPGGGLRLSLTDQLPSGCFFQLPPQLTEGMQRNAILALSVASHLGMNPDVLNKRLQDWEPDGLRGTIIRCSQRSWYLDCYNANPESMIDALKGFDRQFGQGTRCLILGDMLELGKTSPYWHQEIGRSGPWREGDRILLLGRASVHYEKGIEESGIQNLNITCKEQIDEECAEALRQFSGAIFLKGSRSMNLEKLYQNVEGIQC